MQNPFQAGRNKIVNQKKNLTKKNEPEKITVNKKKATGWKT
jgi:hypothetical protein